MSTKNKKSSATGIRYTDAKKKEIVDFVVQYNAKNGRGGQSTASQKYKVSPLTITAWLKAAGVSAAAKAAPKKAAPKKAAPKKAVAKKAAPKKAVAKKGAPKKAAKPAGKMGRGSRYTPEKKQEILDFVAAYNAANGRGGQSQAVAKYKLSPITCASWLKAAGMKPGKKAAKSKAVKAPKAAKAPKAVKAVKPAAVAAPAGLAAKVASLVVLNEAVRKAESELEKLYAKHDALMVSIKGWI
ncbi:MAG: hypothetical protein NTV46_07320 [Verrucomicrobia bacterium]|nr:hypothetical protein [Verrucomicrobiota bacterium]